MASSGGDLSETPVFWRKTAPTESGLSSLAAPLQTHRQNRSME
jgi:hypothetical protein